jgi:hypothetical protein
MNPIVEAIFKAVAKLFGYTFYSFKRRGGGGTMRKR